MNGTNDWILGQNQFFEFFNRKCNIKKTCGLVIEKYCFHFFFNTKPHRTLTD